MTRFRSRLKTPSQLRKEQLAALRRIKMDEQLRRMEEKEMADLKIPPLGEFETPKEVPKKFKRPVKRSGSATARRAKPRKKKVKVVSPVEQTINSPKPVEVEIQAADIPEKSKESEPVEEPQQVEAPVEIPEQKSAPPVQKPPVEIESSDHTGKSPELSKPKRKSRGPNAWTTFMKDFRRKPEIKKLPFSEQMKATSAAWKKQKQKTS